MISKCVVLKRININIYIYNTSKHVKTIFIPHPRWTFHSQPSIICWSNMPGSTAFSSSRTKTIRHPKICKTWITHIEFYVAIFNLPSNWEVSSVCPSIACIVVRNDIKKWRASHASTYLGSFECLMKNITGLVRSVILVGMCLLAIWNCNWQMTSQDRMIEIKKQTLFVV